MRCFSFDASVTFYLTSALIHLIELFQRFHPKIWRKTAVCWLWTAPLNITLEWATPWLPRQPSVVRLAKSTSQERRCPTWKDARRVRENGKENIRKKVLLSVSFGRSTKYVTLELFGTNIIELSSVERHRRSYKTCLFCSRTSICFNILS